jgi:hypothetical protein
MIPTLLAKEIVEREMGKIGTIGTEATKTMQT